MFVLTAQAQTPFFYKLDSENGFYSNEVYEVTQDSFGYIWIGCDAGLFRYDGVDFKHYMHPNQKGRSISKLIVDNKERLWYQNFSGQIFFIENDSSHLYLDFSEKTNSFPLYHIKDDKLMLFGDSQFHIYDLNKKTGKNQLLTTDKQYITPSFLVQISNKNYALCRENFYYFSNKKNFEPLFPSGVFSFHLFLKKDNLSLLFAQNNLTKEWLFINAESQKIIKQFPENAFKERLYSIQSIGQKIMICSSNGAYLVDENFEIENHFLPNEKIASVFLDRENNLWLTSLENGIYILPFMDLKMYDHSFFPQSNITALKSYNNLLKIGTYSGDIYHFNPKTSTYRQIDIPTERPYKNVRRFFENETYFAIPKGPKTIVFDKKTGTKNVLSIGNLRDLIVFQDTLYGISNIIFGREGLQSQDFQTIIPEGGNAITKDPTSDTIYFASKNGLFNYINGKVNHIPFYGKNIVPTAFDWHQDTLWVTTISNGFLAYHHGVFHYQFFPAESKKTTCRTLKVHQNQLLVASDIGILKMNLDTKKYEIFDISEGLHQREISAIEVINNDVFLGTTKGVIRFPMNGQTQNKAKPNIVITNIVVNDSIFYHGNTLKYHQNNIQFNFKTALFKSRQKFTYEYRLRGLSDNWETRKATSPFVKYNTLPPNKYIFEVRAVNEDNVKSDIQTVRFTIKSPFWKRWWFVLLSIILVGMTIYSLVLRRINRIKKQEKVERDYQASQLTALKAQMNPHFLYNALNSIQELILEEDIPNASSYLAKFSHLMRRILDASEPTSISLSDELKILNLYLELEKLRFEDRFEYQIELPENIRTTQIHIPSMIIQPFVENAIKHGLLHKKSGIKRINIRFQLDDLLICEIKDNGIGRKRAKAIQERQGRISNSFAISAIQKRLDILNQKGKTKIGLEIEDLYENEQAKGTKVRLKMPYTHKGD